MRPADGAGAGRIILLNGTSSSGKSSLVRALQVALDEPWIEIGIDTMVFALPRAWLDQPRWAQVFRYVAPEPGADVAFRVETGELGRRLVSGMHRAVAALAGRGLDVIVDHVLLEPAWLDDCRAVWAGHDVLFVGVRCPREVLEARERARRDRTVGQAAAQLDVVHRRGGYDVEVDTSLLSPTEAAAAVLSAGFPPRPFARLDR